MGGVVGGGGGGGGVLRVGGEEVGLTTVIKHFLTFGGAAVGWMEG